MSNVECPSCESPYEMFLIKNIRNSGYHWYVYVRVRLAVIPEHIPDSLSHAFTIGACDPGIEIYLERKALQAAFLLFRLQDWQARITLLTRILDTPLVGFITESFFFHGSINKDFDLRWCKEKFCPRLMWRYATQSGKILKRASVGVFLTSANYVPLISSFPSIFCYLSMSLRNKVHTEGAH